MGTGDNLYQRRSMSWVPDIFPNPADADLAKHAFDVLATALVPKESPTLKGLLSNLQPKKI